MRWGLLALEAIPVPTATSAVTTTASAITATAAKTAPIPAAATQTTPITVETTLGARALDGFHPQRLADPILQIVGVEAHGPPGPREGDLAILAHQVP